jgi:hypothetical protein
VSCDESGAKHGAKLERLIDLSRKLINYSDKITKGRKGLSQPIDPDFLPIPFRDCPPKDPHRKRGQQLYG